ncbi:MAG: hypothetical protein K9M08_08815 [Pirellula sp.]|nr:hypothetical protein [Pirellula sp.]
MKLVRQSVYCPTSDDPEIPLIVHARPESRHRNLVVLVHGIGGRRYGRRSSFGKFPKLIFTEGRGELDVGNFGFRTLERRLVFWKTNSIDDEARILAETLRDLPKTYASIVVLARGLGGLIAKAAISYLIKTNQRAAVARLTGLIFVDVPQAGVVNLPRFLRWISPDFHAIRAHGELAKETHRTFIDHIEIDATVKTREKIVIPLWSLSSAFSVWSDSLSANLNVPSRQTKLIRTTLRSLFWTHDRNGDAFQFLWGCISESTHRFERMESLLPTRSFFPTIHPSGGFSSVQESLDLFRIDAAMPNATSSLYVDIGFFPFYISPIASVNEQETCGCAAARFSIEVSSGELDAEPTVTQVPASSTVQLEYANLAICQLRIESQQNKIIEGQVKIQQEVTWSSKESTCRKSNLIVRPLKFKALKIDKDNSMIEACILQAYFSQLQELRVAKTLEFDE